MILRAVDELFSGTPFWKRLVLKSFSVRKVWIIPETSAKNGKGNVVKKLLKGNNINNANTLEIEYMLKLITKEKVIIIKENCGLVVVMLIINHRKSREIIYPNPLR